MTTQEDLTFWLRLVLTEGIGPQTARTLLHDFGLPENIFAAGYPALQKRVPEKLARLLCHAPSEAMQEQISKTIAWASQADNYVLTFADANYPASLLTIVDPPPLIYAKGRIELLQQTAIAIVGSRNATTQGMQNAERFAQTFSDASLTVISGMALGIDAAAHIGALRNAQAPGNGSTIAVIGTGIDLVYPARHRALAHQIADQGCLISEYALSTPAISSNFPRRNRLISGLAQGVLVVEAAAQSGSLITARSALEQGRDVFAIPGSIHSPLSKGCHQLIRQGAKLVESASDVLEELRWQKNPVQITNTTAEPAMDAGDQALLDAIGHDPVSIDQLVIRTSQSAAVLQAELLKLEMLGQVESLAGGQFRLLK